MEKKCLLVFLVLCSAVSGDNDLCTYADVNQSCNNNVQCKLGLYQMINSTTNDCTCLKMFSLTVGTACTETYQCVAGTFCDTAFTLKCTQEAKAAQACRSDDNCQRGYGCLIPMIPAGQTIGACTLLASIGNGKDASDSEFCAYGLILNNGICQAPLAVQCGSNEQCTDNGAGMFFCCKNSVCSQLDPASCEHKYNTYMQWGKGQNRNSGFSSHVYDSSVAECEFNKCTFAGLSSTVASKGTYGSYPCNTAGHLIPSFVVVLLFAIFALFF